MIRWAEARLEGAQFRDDAVAIGNERNGRLCAVVVFDTFSTTSCLVHLVSDGSKKWMTRDFIRAGFAYPFIQCGYRRIATLVSANNEAALKLNQHFGWVIEGRMREDGLHGEDNIVMGMLRRECRYVPQTFLPVRSPLPSKSASKSL